MTGRDLLLSVEGLRVSIPTDDGSAEVLDHVDLSIPRGGIVGVVGESGCGKSTLVRAVLGILPKAARVTGGRVVYDGEDLFHMSQGELTSRIRGKEIAFIPQDPYLALNPLFTVGTQLLEIMRWHGVTAQTVVAAGAPIAPGSSSSCALCRFPIPRRRSTAIPTSSAAASASVF